MLDLDDNHTYKLTAINLQYYTYTIYLKDPFKKGEFMGQVGLKVKTKNNKEFGKWLLKLHEDLDKFRWEDFLSLLWGIKVPLNIEKITSMYIEELARFRKDYQYTINEPLGRVRYTSSLCGEFVLNEEAKEVFVYKKIVEYDIPNGDYFEGLEVFNKKTPEQCIYIPSQCSYPSAVERELQSIFGKDARFWINNK